MQCSSDGLFFLKSILVKLEYIDQSKTTEFVIKVTRLINEAYINMLDQVEIEKKVSIVLQTDDISQIKIS